MKNLHFGSKIKIPKNMSKSILKIIPNSPVQKTAPKNTKYSRNESILKIGHHACKGYSPCKILTLVQKLKLEKNTSKSILQIISSCSVLKTARKNTKYSRNESIWKIGRHACRGYSPCKILTSAQKLKFQKNMSKSILQIISSCSVEKTAPKQDQMFQK